MLVWARMATEPRPGAAAVTGALVPLRGTAKIDDRQLIWSCGDDEAAIRRALQSANNALVLIDVACDYLVDVEGRPVSGSGSRFVDVESSPAGGIFRTWLGIRLG